VLLEQKYKTKYKTFRQNPNEFRKRMSVSGDTDRKSRSENVQFRTFLLENHMIRSEMGSRFIDTSINYEDVLKRTYDACLP